MKPYQLSWQEVIKKFNTDENVGLTSIDAKKRLTKYGENKIPQPARDSWIKVFFRQFDSPLIYILLIAAMIIFFFADDRFDAFIITGVLLFNAILGAVQEGKAQSILESLHKFIKAECVVIRDGKKLFIDEKELVPGDIILLLEGERVPADVRIIDVSNLQIDESILTGESKFVKKIAEGICYQPDFGAKPDAEILTYELDVHDQKNMAFKGTYIVSGSAKAVVVQTGSQTQIGKISACIEEIEEQMPLRQEINRLAKFIIIFILLACLFIFVVGIFTGKPVKELLVLLTALFICVVPEGLPVVLTLVLVMGARKLAQKNVLVKKMQAVQGLGNIDTILIDKTGTLTRNELLVSKIIIDKNEYAVSGYGYFYDGQVSLNGKVVSGLQDEKLMSIAKAGCLLNRAEINYIQDSKTFEIKGDPTEAAMFVMSKKIGLDQDCLSKQCKIIYEIPFNSKWRYHAIFCKIAGKATAFISGAPEIIMARSKSITNIEKENLDRLLKEGFRVVAVATKDFDEDQVKMLESANGDLTGQVREKFFEDFVLSGLDFVGLCGINDSIREDVVDLIKKIKKADIDIIMLTGDHKDTAIFVASRVGIYNQADTVIEGYQIDLMSEQEFMNKLDSTTVFARVTPEHKLKIVNAYKLKDKVVAMTGDGVNDAPSLVAANIGIAMGGIGTEVAKQASDIILLDDSFASIAAGIEFGRHIFYTLRRVILYFFSTNMGEILVVLFSVILGLPLPITAAQILWLNLITDGFLDTAISAEKVERDITKINVFKKGEKIIDKRLMYKVLYMALPMGIASIVIFYWYYQIDIVLARTMTLITMAMFQWFNAFNCRSEKRSVFELGLFSNKWLTLAVIGVLGLQFLVIYNPVMQKIFNTKAISVNQWLLVFLVSSSIFWIEEIRKFVAKRL